MKKKTKNELLNYQSNFSFLGVGVPNFPFWQPGRKRAHPQNTIKNRGFREQIFEKQLCVTETAIFGPKKPKSGNSSCHFFLVLLFQQQKHKNAPKPLFL